MLYLGARSRELKPEVAAHHENQSVYQNQIGKVLGIPMESLFIAHLIDETVLLEVQVCFQPSHFSMYHGWNYVDGTRVFSTHCISLWKANDLILHYLERNKQQLKQNFMQLKTKKRPTTVLSEVSED